jgi:tetratricopeptide (TPR) repeat protein
MRKLLAALLVLAFATALLSGGRQRIGRLLLSAGMPSAAAVLLLDPEWKGVAFYSAQRWSEAADAFRASGTPESAYNLGNALAQARLYADALAAYDQALAESPDDDDARNNRAIIAALLEAEASHPSKRVAGSSGSAATQHRDRDDGAPSGENARSSGRDGMAGTRETASDSGSVGGALKRASTAPGHSFDAIRSESAGSAANDGGIGQAGGARRTLLEDSARMAKPIEMEAAQVDRQWLQTLSDDPGRFLKLRLAAEHNRRVDAGTAPPITGDPW